MVLAFQVRIQSIESLCSHRAGGLAPPALDIIGISSIQIQEYDSPEYYQDLYPPRSENRVLRILFLLISSGIDPPRSKNMIPICNPKTTAMFGSRSLQGGPKEPKQNHNDKQLVLG